MKNAVCKLVLPLALIFSGPQAFADGFVCNGQKTGLKITVYNQTQASAGTRTPASFVISDPVAARPNRTIASFSPDRSNSSGRLDGTVEYQGYGSFVAKVSPALAESPSGDRIVAGTKLADLETIHLDVDFSYASGTARLARVTESIPAKISYHERTGAVINEAAVCTRYLKVR